MPHLHPDLVRAAYLVASVLFILGIKGLSSPKSARNGNTLAAIGMLLAIVVTLLDRAILTYGTILIGMVIGGVVGTVAARRVAMTAMPQMVALFNGSGGGAAAIVSSLEYLAFARAGQPVPPEAGVTILLGALIGAISFTGSIVAFGKLQGIVTEKAVTYPLQKPLNLLLFVGIIAISVWLVATGQPNPVVYAWFAGLCLLFGILFVIPIGGGDMPVVISLLNSFTGLATAATGFSLHNYVLIISGTLVGASGTLLTYLMCKAMNRPITNVLFGAFGAIKAGGGAAGATSTASAAGKSVRDVSVEDAATMLAYARKVIIIPGYGLAVAQAQHGVRELADLLKSKGVEVKYAIHPVAGRMPGHMNVLLAEANVPYPELYDLDQINPEFGDTDVALVIGANDVVNPAARTDTSSPIYGMPILDADKAKHIIISKRSMKPGFAGIENELFYDPKTMMLFGDAKDSITKLVQAVKAL
ncbi:MAG TPA: NAD(P)(+) transhydrogenase (Re/Si-specific) subunit beta [Candidatus Polarisedimenticolia bacterium]|nr:NAD(P)(+) transhydrogenase (Re/Si-specific) subunit beta [Candidatus Polarisedimenticolia bacterium]